MEALPASVTVSNSRFMCKLRSVRKSIVGLKTQRAQFAAQFQNALSFAQRIRFPRVPGRAL